MENYNEPIAFAEDPNDPIVGYDGEYPICFSDVWGYPLHEWE